MQEIRDYFLQQARKVDRDIKAKDKPLNDEEIAQADIDCAYHLYIGIDTTVARKNDAVDDNFQCSMRLYIGAYNCDNEEYDKGYNKALCIRNELVKASNIGENEFVTDVEPTRIVPSPADDNRKVFIFDINVNVSVVMCL